MGYLCLLYQFHEIIQIDDINRRIIYGLQDIIMMVVGNNKTCICCYRTINELVVIRVLCYQSEIVIRSNKLNKPAIDNGFYYDFLFSSEKQIKEEDLKKIQNQMEKIVKENQDFVLFSLPDDASKKLVVELMKQKYKEEMRSEFASA